jgi:hypothetical protein
MSFLQKLNKRITSAEEQLREAKQLSATFDQVAQVMDQVKFPPSCRVTGQSINSWNPQVISFFIYTLVKSIPDLLPVLEHLENAFSSEFTSHDTADGARIFSLSAWDGAIGIVLAATPDLESPDSTCRKILVGQDERVERVSTPRYAIQCDGELLEADHA